MKKIVLIAAVVCNFADIAFCTTQSGQTSTRASEAAQPAATPLQREEIIAHIASNPTLSNMATAIHGMSTHSQDASAHSYDAVVDSGWAEFTDFLNVAMPVDQAMSFENVSAALMGAWMDLGGYDSGLPSPQMDLYRLAHHANLVTPFCQIFSLICRDNFEHISSRFLWTFLDNTATRGGCYVGYRNRMVIEFMTIYCH